MTDPWSYDLIASFYATDMGRSMPFDDVGCYRRIAQQYPGQVLELGCGTGRILIELLAAGMDMVGADRSLPMLKQLQADAALRALEPRVVQMDLRALTFVPASFAVVLAPYSLITYLTEPDDLQAFLQQASALLKPGGALVLDAFVPRDVAPFDDYREDYSRPHGFGTLERAKRIAVLADGCNRIERRYRLRDADGNLLREVHTAERIRPQTPAALRALLGAHGLRIASEWHDYLAAGTSPADSARFCTLVATR